MENTVSSVATARAQWANVSCCTREDNSLFGRHDEDRAATTLDMHTVMVIGL